MEKKIRSRPHISLVLLLTVAIGLPLFLARCGSSSGGAPSLVNDVTPTSTKHLYVATQTEDENLLIRIDTFTSTVLNRIEIGFTPDFPANQLNEGTVFWGAQDSKLFGFDILTGVSKLRGAQQTKNIHGEVTAQDAASRSATASGVSLPSDSWTAVTKDGKRVVVASRMDKVAENGQYIGYDDSGNVQYRLDPVTGETRDASGVVLKNFLTQYDGYGGVMLGRNPGLGREKARAGPSDISIVSTDEIEYCWGVDVNGDTLTGFIADNGEMVAQGIVMPLGPGEVADGFVAPFKGTAGTTSNGISIVTVENLNGSKNGGSESIWDVSVPSAPVELVRFYDSFEKWDFSVGKLPNYSDVISAYPGKLSGAVSTAIYEWASPEPGYPRFIVDGAASGVTSEIDPKGRFAYMFAGDRIPVIDLGGDAPWVISHVVTLTTSGAVAGVFSEDGNKCYVSTGGNDEGILPVIDTSSHSVIDLIPIFGRARGMAMM